MGDSFGGSSCVMKTGALCLSPILTRRPTDKFFILLLPINFLLWLGIGIYEMYIESERLAGRYPDPSGDERRKTKKPTNAGELDLILLKSLLNITIYTLVSAGIIISFLFITTALKAKFVVYTAISLIVITIVSLIMLTPWETVLLISDSMGSHSLLIAAIVVTVLYLIYEVTIFVCTKETNVTLSAELLSKSCAAILHSLKAVLVSLALAFSSIIVLMLTINISLAKTFDIIFANNFRYLKASQKWELSYMDLLPISVFFVGGLYTFNFIWNFGLTVMGDYSANFYARSNDQKQSDVDIFKSVKRVSRNHLGTIGFLSMPILPSICALTMAFKSNNQFSSKISSVSISFFSKLCLILDISDYALVNTSIHGCKALKSIREMFDLHQRSSLLFFTLNAISTKAVEICIVVATIIGLIIRIFSVPTYHDIPFIRWKPVVTEDMMFYEIFVAAIYVNYICKSVTRAAMCTFTIYQMTSVRMSDALDDHNAMAEQSI